MTPAYEALFAWVDEDPNCRRFELRYSPFRVVGATQWTGGWRVVLKSSRWRVKQQGVTGHSSFLEDAVDRALTRARGRKP